MLSKKQTKKKGASAFWACYEKTKIQILLSILFRRFCCFSIGIYQHCIAPLFPPVCRFQPSCSDYAKAAFSKYGFRKGTLLMLRRLFRCHPWGDSGYDPLL